uniref:Uncharacterized protein n=1 Tax=Ciona savignyi TaxID=51511 RepID=H2ZIZ2_CIOSA
MDPRLKTLQVLPALKVRLAPPPHGKLTHKKQQESCPSLGELNREQKAKHPSETVPRPRRPVSIHCVSNNEQKPHDNRNRSASMVNMKTSSRHVTGVTPIEEEVSPASSVTSKSTLMDDGFHTLPKKRKSPMFLRKNDSVRSGPSPEGSTRPTSTSLTPRLGSNGNPQVRKAESTHSLPDLKSGSQSSQNNNSTNGDFDAKPNKPKRTIGNIFKRKKKSEKT